MQDQKPKWWRTLPTREEYGPAANSIDPATDVCFECGVSESEHALRSPGCKEVKRVLLFCTNWSEQPGTAEDGHLETFLTEKDGTRVEFGDIEKQRPPEIGWPKPSDGV